MRQLITEMIASLLESNSPIISGFATRPALESGGRGRSFQSLPKSSVWLRWAELEAYEAELRGKPADEVCALYEEQRRRQAAEAQRKRQARAEAEERSRFFNRPGAAADFVHWSKAAYWTIDEGVALLLGRAPEVTSWEAIRNHAEVSPFVRQYTQLRDLALRARESGQLALRSEPSAFLDWAKHIGIRYPCELDRYVHRGMQREAAGDPNQARPQAAVIKERPLLTRERDTVLKMLGGIAVAKYGYDPRAGRNSAISAIVADLDRAGVHVDADTVRKWIREAADNLPPEALEDPER